MLTLRRPPSQGKARVSVSWRDTSRLQRLQHHPVKQEEHVTNGTWDGSSSERGRGQQRRRLETQPGLARTGLRVCIFSRPHVTVQLEKHSSRRPSDFTFGCAFF